MTTYFTPNQAPLIITKLGAEKLRAAGIAAQPGDTWEDVAERCATQLDPRGCTCPNNGDADCPWCQNKSIAHDAVAACEEHLEPEFARQLQCAERSLTQFPCLDCADRVTQHPQYWKLDDRCPACRITMGERIALGTLLLAGPDMETKVAAFIREHRIPN